MMYRIIKSLRLIILLIIIFNSCQKNSPNKGFEIFNDGLSDEAINKIATNSPFPFSEKVISNHRHYAHFEMFGNSGIAVQYKISEDNKVGFNTRLEQYKFVAGDSITYRDSTNVYVYKEQDKNIKIPELSYEFGNFSDEKIYNSGQVDVYIIEKGKLSNVFLKGDDKNYNYTIGMYHFKNRSTVFYWFLVYEDKKGNEQDRISSASSTVGNNI